MFSTTFRRQAIALTIMAVLVMILVATAAFGKVPTVSDRANTAWSERLAAQAQAEQAARAAAAWSARLEAQAAANPNYAAIIAANEAARAKRAADAYSLRLTKLAEYELAKAK